MNRILVGTDGRRYELLLKGVVMLLVRQYITPIPGRVIDSWEPKESFISPREKRYRELT